MSSIPVALQLWTVRDACKFDFFGALEEIAKIGYRWIEPYDFFDTEIEEFKDYLADQNLRVLSSHVPLDRLENKLDKVIEEHVSLNCHHLVCPWLDEERRAGPEVFEKVGRSLAAIEAKVSERGFSLDYHNHDFEFTLAKDPDGLQRVLAQSSNVGSQLDVFWAANAGINPVEYMDQLGPRLKSVHLKDGDAAAGTFTPLGQGSLDIPAILEAGRRLRVRSFVVEQDEHEADAMESARQSFEYLREQGAVR